MNFTTKQIKQNEEKKFKEEIAFILFGGDIEKDGENQHYQGMIDNQKNFNQMLSAVNNAILALSRILNVSPEDLDRESNNGEANFELLTKLKDLGAARVRKQQTDAFENKDNITKPE